jgi:hypothetical protein
MSDLDHLALLIDLTDSTHPDDDRCTSCRAARCEHATDPAATPEGACCDFTFHAVA